MAAVRLPGVYGPMERSLASRPHTSAPFRLMAALRGGHPVRVAGPDVSRDWSYAADMAAGIWALLTAAQWRYPVYNLSCGVAISFAQVVQAFVEHGLSAEWVADADEADIAMRPQQVRAPLDIARIEQDAGFRAAYSIRAGVDAWLRDESL